MFAQMNEFSERIETMRKQMQETIKAEGEGALKSMFKELFDKYPAITRIRWQQYTPHFNDGDECRFGVHEPYFTIDGIADEVDSWNIKYCVEDKKTLDASFLQYIEPMKAVSTALYKLKDTLETVFGDHVEVTATRDSIVAEECDHD